MFKLTQLIHRGRQVKELKEIQKEKERIKEELNKYEIFPKCYDDKKRKYITTMCMLEDLSNTLTLIFLGRAPFEALNLYCGNNFNLENAQDYFKDLGNYFLSLSGNLETRKPLEERLSELCEKEKKLKEKLGIK